MKSRLLADPPVWAVKSAKILGRSLHTHRMLDEKEPLLLAVSGGKDSLSLALLFALRRRWVRPRRVIEAVMLEWKDAPFSAAYREDLQSFFNAIAIPLHIVEAERRPGPRRTHMNCYDCARARKKHLFEEMAKRGFRTVATGHHLDDFVETALMNMIAGGELQAMPFRRSFFDDRFRIIRPLCAIRESALRRIAEHYRLPVAQQSCMYADANTRAEIKALVSRMAHLNKNARNHIFHAATGCVVKNPR